MILIDGQPFEVEIERKKMKNIYLRLKGNTLRITCPYWVSEEKIISFLMSKREWILDAIKKQNERQENSMLIIGDSIAYRGKRYPLHFVHGAANVQIKEEGIFLYGKDEGSALHHFYEKGKKVLLKEVEVFEKEFLPILQDYGYYLKPEYSFRKMKSTWGVCYTRRNKISLNPLLIHFSPICLKAVLWHELLHFILPNHSKRFHALLQFHMPEYKEIMKQLR